MPPASGDRPSHRADGSPKTTSVDNGLLNSLYSNSYEGQSLQEATPLLNCFSVGRACDGF